MWKHMRKLRQRDVGRKRILKPAGTWWTWSGSPGLPAAGGLWSLDPQAAHVVGLRYIFSAIDAQWPKKRPHPILPSCIEFQVVYKTDPPDLAGAGKSPRREKNRFGDRWQ